jgi:quinol monooxygenase YgiN
MYISIRRYKTNQAAEFTRKVQDEFVPLISKQPGFVGYYAIEAGGDTWVSISVFDNQAQAEDSNRLGGDWAKKTGLIADPPEITAGKAVVHKTK